MLDNLNIHKIASLYVAFAAPEARRFARKLEFHLTPKHGSRLNVAESELAVLSSQCPKRRGRPWSLSARRSPRGSDSATQTLSRSIGCSPPHTPAASSGMPIPSRRNQHGRPRSAAENRESRLALACRAPRPISDRRSADCDSGEMRLVGRTPSGTFPDGVLLTRYATRR
ncbi:MAG: transposase [Chloroflexi bacterium]|nr:transposase [Chloroflexota bacterium]